MKITLEPTGRLETVTQDSGSVQCRIWEGATDSGAKLVAYIPVIAVHQSATPEEAAAFERELRNVKADRQLVSFDLRMALD